VLDTISFEPQTKDMGGHRLTLYHVVAIINVLPLNTVLSPVFTTKIFKTYMIYKSTFSVTLNTLH
jgi:hypothetical protein